MDIVYTQMLPWELCLFLLPSWREGERERGEGGVKKRQIKIQSLSTHIAFHEIKPLQECFEETAIFKPPLYRLDSCSPPLSDPPVNARPVREERKSPRRTRTGRFNMIFVLLIVFSSKNVSVRAS